MEILSQSLKETEVLAEEVLGDVSEIHKTKNGASILCLYGNLGAGKTTFSQMLGKLLGVKERMQSPTFLILKNYKTKNKIFKKFIHIDAYRIENPKEIVALGWNEIIADQKNLIVVEWPEKIKKVLPKNTHDIYFEFVDEKTRAIKLNLQ